MAEFRFKRPRHGVFYHYCGDCLYYTFERQTGCAYTGVCSAIPDEPEEKDAYDKPCGLWTEKRPAKAGVSKRHKACKNLQQ